MSIIIQALQIIAENPGVTPKMFGHMMWPDHPGWQRRGKCGAYGSTGGVGMNLLSGGYLGKLRKKKLIEGSSCPEGYRITKQGKLFLVEGLLKQPIVGETTVSS